MKEPASQELLHFPVSSPKVGSIEWIARIFWVLFEEFMISGPPLCHSQSPDMNM